MKINLDIQKSKDTVTNLLQKTSEAGKKAVEDVQKSATAISEKAKQDSYERRLKKYNPLFPDVYNSVDFKFPEIIVIVDEHIRRGIDVCEGAVGWRDSEGNTETLYLYNTASNFENINFYPKIASNTAYYVDSFNSKRYIQVDCIFDKAHEERLAELKSVAHALGAKRCTIEIKETSHEMSSAENKKNLGMGKLFSSKVTQLSQNTSHRSRSGRITAEFEGCSTPHKPKLKWFAQDENIKKLIDMRCKQGNALKSETLYLAGSSSATMSKSAAASIDSAVKRAGIGAGISMGSEATREHESQLIFEIEF